MFAQFYPTCVVTVLKKHFCLVKIFDIRKLTVLDTTMSPPPPPKKKKKQTT